MQRRGFSGRIVRGCLALAIAAVPLAAAAEDWHEQLSRQVSRDEACVVTFMSQVVERTVNGKHIIMAKVHCEDKRSFDAYRGSDDEPFRLTACEVPNAETC